jgi:hypothetical protein
MMDVESEITESFERLYPVPVVTADWGAVLDRARPRPRSRTALLFPPMTMRRRVGLVVGVAVVIGVALLAGSMSKRTVMRIRRSRCRWDVISRPRYPLVRRRSCPARGTCSAGSAGQRSSVRSPELAGVRLPRTARSS